LDALFTELLDAVLIELLDALFTELLDAVLTELLDAVLTELLDAVLTEPFVDDLAATALPRDPPLLTCFDLEEASAAATFGLLGVGDLAVLGLARIRGAAVSTLAGLSTAVISGLCTAASDSPLLVDLDSDSPRAPSTPPPVLVTRTFGAFCARNKFRLNSAVGDSVQTLAASSQSMPALPQSALVSGWLGVSIRSGSPNAPMDSAARPDPALPSIGE
jgi:AcrR family transcriptional regulator